MSYVVLALKWRPRNFGELIGQEHVVATLTNAINKNRLAYAYLFSGPRGVGKTSAARILAKALNCSRGPTAQPCDSCTSCLEIAQGRSLDVIEIDGASNRGIDEIRALRESVKFSPAKSRYKIYIIDEVHQITTDGFNALLKTLEEPPPYVKFIFATTQPSKVIPTIISRCQRLDFRRIPVMEIINQLEKIAQSENISVDPHVLLAVAKASDGALRDAESILDQLAAFSGQSVSLDDVVTMFGMVEQDFLFKLTQCFLEGDAAGALTLLDSAIKEGKEISSCLSNLIEHFRNLMVAKVSGQDTQLIDLPQDVCRALEEQAGKISMENILKAFNILTGTHEMTRRLESARAPMEISLVRLTQELGPNTKHTLARPKVQSGQMPVQADTRTAASVARAQTPAAQQPKAPAEHKKEIKEQDMRPKGEAPVALLNNDTLNALPEDFTQVSLDTVRQSWEELISNLSRIKMSVATYLNEGNPLGVQGNMLTVGFPRNCKLHKEVLEENRQIVERSVSELVKSSLRLNFVLKEDAPVEKGKDNPLVRTTMELFGARLIKEE